MIWPAGTPNEITIPSLVLDPRLTGTPEEPAQNILRDNTIISLEISRLSHVFVILTWRAVYIYQLKVCVLFLCLRYHFQVYHLTIDY